MKRIAIVTGASSGLGKEFTKQISNKTEFDEIWIIARRQEKLNELANQINSQKNMELIKPVPLDISGRNGVYLFKEYFEKEIEKLNDKLEIGLLINNAGFGTYGPFIETSCDRELEMIDLNCTTLTGLCSIAIPYMPKGSVLINTASLAGYMPLGNFAVYGATKSYVLNFTIALAAELKEKGIKVCALCPGSVSTEFANVASNGARKEVKGGIGTEKVVAQCLKRAYNGKKTSLLRFKWKFNSFLSRIIGRYTVARFTYKYNPRPHNPYTN